MKCRQKGPLIAQYQLVLCWLNFGRVEIISVCEHKCSFSVFTFLCSHDIQIIYVQMEIRQSFRSKSPPSTVNVYKILTSKSIILKIKQAQRIVFFSHILNGAMTKGYKATASSIIRTSGRYGQNGIIWSHHNHLFNGSSEQPQTWIMSLIYYRWLVVVVVGVWTIPWEISFNPEIRTLFTFMPCCWYGQFL